MKKTKTISLLLMTSLAFTQCKGPAFYPPAVTYYPLSGYSMWGRPYYNVVYYSGPRMLPIGGYGGFRPWGSSWGVYQPVYTYGNRGWAGHNTYSFGRSTGSTPSMRPTAGGAAAKGAWAARKSALSTQSSNTFNRPSSNLATSTTTKPGGFWNRLGVNRKSAATTPTTNNSNVGAKSSTTVGRSSSTSTNTGVKSGNTPGTTRSGWGSTGRSSST